MSVAWCRTGCTFDRTVVRVGLEVTMSTPATSKSTQVAIGDAMRVSGQSSPQATGHLEGAPAGQHTGMVEGKTGERGSAPESGISEATGVPAAVPLAPVEDWSQAWHQVRAREIRAMPRGAGSTVSGRRVAVLGHARRAARARPGVRSCLLDARPPVPERPAPVALTRRGRLVVVAAMVSLVLVVAGGGGLAVHRLVAGPPAGPERVRQVQVHPGQTLWDIAHSAAPEADVRTTVDRIVELNGLSGAGDLRVGENLRVPVTQGE